MLLANRSLNFLLNLAIFTLFMTPLNNQEATVTKNPMEQVKLEFQMLRAKQNLISPNLTEKITITAKNCPTLHREISKIAQNFKIFTPEITISELKRHQTNYKHWTIQYNRSENKLIIGNNLLDQLTMPELRNLIASEIGYKICMMGNSTGWNFLKVIGLNLIPMTFICACFLSPTLFLWSLALYIPYILLAPIIFPNFATKEDLQCSLIINLSLLLIIGGSLFLFAPLFYGIAVPAFAMLSFMAIFLPQVLVYISMLLSFICLIPICSWIAESYANSYIEIALDKLPYLPNAKLLNSAINKIETNSKFYCQSKFKSQLETSQLNSWCKHRRNFAAALAEQSLKRQYLAAQVAAMDELVDNDSKSTGLEQSAL